MTATAGGATPIVDWCPSGLVHPAIAVRRSRAHITDERGQEWIALLSGWGSNILGYDHPRVLDAVRTQLGKGIGTGIQTPVWTEVVRLLQKTVPCAEQVAFGKNGSDVTTGAVRLARAFTGRERVLIRGYHGFQDWYMASDPGCLGIPGGLRETVAGLPVNDIGALGEMLELADNIAAVIVDPAALPIPDSAYLLGLVALCREHGVLVIFDEVVTGFRLAPGGAQEHYGVKPDLACFAKAMANGFPLSALVGPEYLMATLPATRFGMTFASEVVSLAAAQATISEICENDVCSALWAKGEFLRQGLRRGAERCGLNIELAGEPPRTQVIFSDQGGLSERLLRWLFLQELGRQQILATGILLISLAHDDDDLERVIAVSERAFEVVAEAVERGSAENLMAAELLASVRAADDRTACAPPPASAESPQPTSTLGHLIRRGSAGVRRRLRLLFGGPKPIRLPDDFDWRAYLRRYPDLQETGHDTEAKAALHFQEYGAREGRWATRESYPPRRAMSCPAVHSLFLRAWGDLACWDDAGVDGKLQPFDQSTDYARDVFLGPVSDRIRQDLYANRMPFPEYCSRCICLETEVMHTSYNRDCKVMETFHLEPSFRCMLDCPGCIKREVRRLAPRPHSLQPEVLEKILRDLDNGGVTVRRFNLQGHGEPLLNPDLAGLVGLAKSFYPNAYLAINTNANRPFDEEMVRAGVDELVCSVDGVDQASYEKYRVGGDFAATYRFMSDAAAAAPGLPLPLRIVWRYTVFEHNDKPEQLLEAQRLAREAGIGQMLFVLSSNGPMSNRMVRAEQIPVLDPGVPVAIHAHSPSPGDLERRLKLAEEALEGGNESTAGSLVASVARNLSRFYLEKGRVSVNFESVLADVTRLAERLPEQEIAAVHTELELLNAQQ